MEFSDKFCGLMIDSKLYGENPLVTEGTFAGKGPKSKDTFKSFNV